MENLEKDFDCENFLKRVKPGIQIELLKSMGSKMEIPNKDIVLDEDSSFYDILQNDILCK
jgi:hypothetical protein